MKATVLGLGPSLQPWYAAFNGTKQSDLTIGVNDILRHVSSDCIDAIAFVDGRGAFTAERWAHITQNPLPKYTWLYGPDIEGVENLYTVPVSPLKFVHTEGQFRDKIYYGSMSIIFAISLAAYQGATEIEVHGCDIVNHPELASKKSKIIDELKFMIYALSTEGIKITWSQHSPLLKYLQAAINTNNRTVLELQQHDNTQRPA